jgi:hypothetical protein
MIRIKDYEELLNTFRPIDQTLVERPDELKFPLVIRDYFAWTSVSGGSKVHLIFSDPLNRVPFGIVFRKDQSSGDGVARMCEWCHSIRTGDGVSLLTAAASSKRRVGIQLCSDLSCRDKAKEEPGIHDFPQLLRTPVQTRQIVRRMSDFAKKNLF